MLQVGDQITVTSFKHNGSVHRVWETNQVIAIEEDYIVSANHSTYVTENDGRCWQTKEPAVSIFFLHEWYNVIAMLRPDGIHYYCNMASPYVIQDQDLTYVDYDLDVGYSPQGTIRLLDEHEYFTHREFFQYPPTLDYLLHQALDQVIQKVTKHEFPFDEAQIMTWFQTYSTLQKKEHIL